MTADARQRSTRGISRRDFLKGVGALIVAFSAAGLAGRLGIAPESTLAQATRATDGQLDSWIAIAADGSVTAYTGKCELGQGLQTAQMQLVAEELGVPIEPRPPGAVRHAVAPGSGHDVGQPVASDQLQPRGIWRSPAQPRAKRCCELAAARLGVPAAQLAVADGVVTASSDPSKSVCVRRSRRRPEVRHRAECQGRAQAGRASGRCSARRCRASTCRPWSTGQLEFVHNVRVPGMLHGRVVRPPAVGATLVSVDEKSVSRHAGRRQGRRQEELRRRRRREAVAGDAGGGEVEGDLDARRPALPAQARFYEHLRTQPSRDTLVVDSSDVDRTLAGAATVVKATYLHPYQMHGSIGTSCAVADVRADRATIWSSTQAVYPPPQRHRRRCSACRPKTCA